MYRIWAAYISSIIPVIATLYAVLNAYETKWTLTTITVIILSVILFLFSIHLQAGAMHSQMHTKQSIRVVNYTATIPFYVSILCLILYPALIMFNIHDTVKYEDFTTWVESLVWGMMWVFTVCLAVMGLFSLTYSPFGFLGALKQLGTGQKNLVVSFLKW